MPKFFKWRSLLKYWIRSTCLPLAVYREVAAHLCQVEGVQTTLISQQSHQFDYYQSQIDRLEIQYVADIPETSVARIQQILAYYSDRYGMWEISEPLTSESTI